MKLQRLAVPLLLLSSVAAQAEVDARLFRLAEVFDLEYASDPRISPDGTRVVYVRNFMDIMSDRRRSNLWVVDADSGDHRALTTGTRNDRMPRWSPDGRRVIYVSSADGTMQIWMRWMDTGQVAKLTNLTRSPGSLSWSPDGRWIAFSMFVETPAKPFVAMPKKPKGAKWASPARVFDKLNYRADGAGYLEAGYGQVFVLSADGGTPRQLTRGPFHHGGAVAWMPDSKSVILAANRREGAEYDPRNTELYSVSIRSGEVKPLTERVGPDQSPAVSPDGTKIAYVGFDDRVVGYQVSELWVMSSDGSGARCLTSGLDRSVANPTWSADGKGLYFQYDDRGRTKIAWTSCTENGTRTLVADVGGTSLGRPYSSGSFTVASNGRVAYTRCTPQRPADIGICEPGGREGKSITRLNEDLFHHKTLGAVEELWFESSHDRRKIQGWIVKPPAFDPSRKYPLVLEIHGGPFANYGPRFAAELQLFAARGYVVLYINPRGSTSYGGSFGNLIHHAYPGNDYDDLISGVDALLEKGYVDRERLYVTGGSGGGVLTSWIVGKTNRFRAAVVAKPVINWYSWVLTADAPGFFTKYWFPGMPWDEPEHYLARSPISLVGNVKTPTMLLTGEADYRTPISESEQYYQALKLRKVDTMLVRIPGASHGIAQRPSHLIAKVAHILQWFGRYE